MGGENSLEGFQVSFFPNSKNFTFQPSLVTPRESEASAWERLVNIAL